MLPSADEATAEPLASRQDSQAAPEFVEVQMNGSAVAINLIPSTEEAMACQGFGENVLEVQVPPESPDVKNGPL
jgi:hypothetical protein